MKIRALLMAAGVSALICLAGCGGGSDPEMTQAEWMSLMQPGLTEAQVTAIVGRGPDGNSVPYHNVPGSAKVDVWNFGDEHGFVDFNAGGQLISAGWGTGW